MEIKDKPKSMSVRQWITKKIATEIIIPENVIWQVITHQFDSGYEALESNNSIEMSGFGKFYYNENKAEKEIEKCLVLLDKCKKVLEGECTEKEKALNERKINVLNKKLQGLWDKQKK